MCYVKNCNGKSLISNLSRASEDLKMALIVTSIVAVGFRLDDKYVSPQFGNNQVSLNLFQY